MRAARKFALLLLRAAVRLASDESRIWGEAMLRELDYVEGDGAVLRWVAGSLAALVKHSVPRQLKAALERILGPARTLRPARKKALEVAAGVGVAAAVLGVLVCVLWRRLAPMLPPAQSERATVAVIAAVEIAYVRGAVALWRQRRPMAMGILIAGLALIVHVAWHARAASHTSGAGVEHAQQAQ